MMSAVVHYHKTRRMLLSLGLVAVVCVPGSSAQAGGFGTYIQQNWLPQLGQMTGQLVAAATYTTGMIGGFFEGAAILNTQRKMQELQAQAIKDYTPGENLCRFGTLTRSLAESQEKAAVTRTTVASLMLNRETGNRSRSKLSANADREARIQNLRQLYCDPGDNDKVPPACNCNLANNTCTIGSAPIGPRQNRDLDFARLWNTRLTMDIDFSNDQMTADEIDLINFFYNISSPDTFTRLVQENMRLTDSPVTAFRWQDMRQIFAARSVSRNSLATLVSTKTPGAGGVADYMVGLLRSMGMSNEEARRMLENEGMKAERPGNVASAKNIDPSYDAQMEILTKKLYQDPNFYVNLIDKPANIKRTKVAMLAVDLMERHRVLDANLRKEMLLSQLLERKIREHEEYVFRRDMMLKSSSQ